MFQCRDSELIFLRDVCKVVIESCCVFSNRICEYYIQCGIRDEIETTKYNRCVHTRVEFFNEYLSIEVYFV